MRDRILTWVKFDPNRKKWDNPNGYLVVYQYPNDVPKWGKARPTEEGELRVEGLYGILPEILFTCSVVFPYYTTEEEE